MSRLPYWPLGLYFLLFATNVLANVHVKARELQNAQKNQWFRLQIYKDHELYTHHLGVGQIGPMHNLLPHPLTMILCQTLSYNLMYMALHKCKSFIRIIIDSFLSILEHSFIKDLIYYSIVSYWFCFKFPDARSHRVFYCCVTCL